MIMVDLSQLERIAEGAPVEIRFEHRFPKVKPSSEAGTVENILQVLRRDRSSTPQDMTEMEVRVYTALAPFYDYDGVVVRLGTADSDNLFEIPGDSVTAIKQLYPDKTVNLSQAKSDRKKELRELEAITDGTPVVVYHNQNSVERLTYGFFMQGAGGILHIKLKNILEEINVPTHRPPGYNKMLILDTLITKYQILE